MFTVTTEQNIPITIKVIRQGENYGLHGSLTHDNEKPLVEFYDARYQGSDGFGPAGQFISRYYLATLLTGNEKDGLTLMGDIPAWSIDPNTMAQVRQQLANMI